VNFHEFMAQVHRLLRPDTYLEIGVRHGESLELADCTSVAIDPAVQLTVELAGNVSLFEQTSDEYFARPDALAPFGGRPASLALIDGMHLVDYVLRDFINVERHARWSTVVVIDDVLPRRSVEATRERSTRFWTGDVYKIVAILRKTRPDLVCVEVDTSPTGVLLVLGLDPQSTVLGDRYDKLARRALRRGIKPGVPRRVLERRGVLDHEAVLGASFWSLLRDKRDLPPGEGRALLQDQLRSDFDGSV
jgi:hypothetical protein